MQIDAQTCLSVTQINSGDNENIKREKKKEKSLPVDYKTYLAKPDTHIVINLAIQINSNNYNQNNGINYYLEDTRERRVRQVKKVIISIRGYDPYSGLELTPKPLLTHINWKV